MARYDDLAAFAAVVRVGSFTRAAAQMGVTQSALSQTVRALERRLDIMPFKEAWPFIKARVLFSGLPLTAASSVFRLH